MSCDNSEVVQVDELVMEKFPDKFIISCKIINNSASENLYLFNTDKPFIEIVDNKLYIYFSLFHDPVPFREAPYRTETIMLYPNQKILFEFDFLYSDEYLTTDFLTTIKLNSNNQMQEDFIVQFGYLTGNIIFLNNPNFVTEEHVVKVKQDGVLKDFDPDELSIYPEKNYITTIDAQQSLQVSGKMQ